LALAVRNGELLLAVQPHVDAAETSMFAVPPLALILAVVEERGTVHPTGASAPGWGNLTMARPIAMLADGVEPVWPLMRKLTGPFPFPVAPDVIVRKLALLPAVHAQVDVTGIDPVVAAALTLVVTAPAVTAHADDGALSSFEHAAAASAAVAATREASNRR